MDFYHVSKYDIADGTSLVDGKNELLNCFKSHEAFLKLDPSHDINYFLLMCQNLKREANYICNNFEPCAKKYATDKMPQLIKCITEGLFEKVRTSKYKEKYSRYLSIYLFDNKNTMVGFFEKYSDMYKHKYLVEVINESLVEKHDMKLFEKSTELMADLLCEKDSSKHVQIYNDIISCVEAYWDGNQEVNPYIECLTPNKNARIISKI